MEKWEIGLLQRIPVAPMDKKQEVYHSFCAIGNEEISHVYKNFEANNASFIFQRIYANIFIFNNKTCLLSK